MAARRPRTASAAHAALLSLADYLATDADYAYKALVFSAPVKAREVTAAEKKLKVQLPPSYVELVTTYGCWKLLGSRPRERDPKKLAARFDRLDGSRALLSPRQIVQRTLDTRRALRAEGDDRGADALDDALLFQQNFYDDNFVIFRISSAATHDGEMTVHDYFHDDRFAWSRQTRFFLDRVREFIDEVRAG